MGVLVKRMTAAFTRLQVSFAIIEKVSFKTLCLLYIVH